MLFKNQNIPYIVIC